MLALGSGVGHENFVVAGVREKESFFVLDAGVGRCRSFARWEFFA
jgi:hypothetical protein